ncbi:hypothetical protein Acor_46460 [Acrocarpospora corrugata]|uniref:Uncharacterized protein n=1 Tax=Acrocarpospora corrugata TaxID=35763 RepID=A0A5M3W2W6_9ACTN|nr:hypothetical protein [Acrocarpospora corrugata]GES02580.1 hypothetical protein Acor_46460 [Acrocarpospora corrugata]
MPDSPKKKTTKATGKAKKAAIKEARVARREGGQDSPSSKSSSTQSAQSAQTSRPAQQPRPAQSSREAQRPEHN